MWSSGPQHHQKWFKNKGRDGYVNYCKGDLEMFLVFMLWRAVRPISGLKWAVVIPLSGREQSCCVFFLTAAGIWGPGMGGMSASVNNKKKCPFLPTNKQKTSQKKSTTRWLFSCKEGKFGVTMGHKHVYDHLAPFHPITENILKTSFLLPPHVALKGLKQTFYSLFQSHPFIFSHCIAPLFPCTKTPSYGLPTV